MAGAGLSGTSWNRSGPRVGRWWETAPPAVTGGHTGLWRGKRAGWCVTAGPTYVRPPGADACGVAWWAGHGGWDGRLDTTVHGRAGCSSSSQLQGDLKLLLHPSGSLRDICPQVDSPRVGRLGEGLADLGSHQCLHTWAPSLPPAEVSC